MPFQGRDTHAIIFSVVAFNSRPSFDEINNENQSFVGSKFGNNVTEKRKIFEESRQSDFDIKPKSSFPQLNAKPHLSSFSEAMEHSMDDEESVVMRNALRAVVEGCWCAVPQERHTTTHLISLFKTWLLRK